MTDSKGVECFNQSERKSKLIKQFLVKSIKEKWIFKEDVFKIVKETMQFNNIWEYFAARNKEEKE